MVKLWNATNGQLLQNFEAIDDCEVAGLSVNDKKQYLASVGWSKSIAFYSGFSFDVVCFLKLESMPKRVLKIAVHVLEFFTKQA